MPATTLHEAALSAYPVGIGCSRCIRRALLTAEMARARPGDTRTLEDAGVHCGKCGSREFTVTRFQKGSAVHSFIRNH